MIRLLIKTFDNDKKYLCKRELDDYMTYRGSGVNVTDDLILVGTEILFETEDKEEFKRVGRYYSELFDVEKSSEWLNIRNEDGDGGDTKSGTKAYNNGSRTGFFVEGTQPDEWELGRHDKHNFSRAKQKDKNNKRKYTPLSEETKNKISDAHSIEIQYKGVTYTSVTEAARINGCGKTKIYNWIKKNDNTQKN